MTNLKNICAALCLVPGMLIAQNAAAAAPEPIVKALMTKAMTNIPGKEVLMLSVEYPPGGADPVHRHDAHGFIYVLEGTIVMGVKGGKEHTLKAGQTFHEGPDEVHTVGRNASNQAGKIRGAAREGRQQAGTDTGQLRR